MHLVDGARAAAELGALQRREVDMSLFGLGADTSIRAMINLERTEVGKGWFGSARMDASESRRVELQSAPMFACEGRRAILEGGGPP